MGAEVLLRTPNSLFDYLNVWYKRLGWAGFDLNIFAFAFKTLVPVSS